MKRWIVASLGVLAVAPALAEAPIPPPVAAASAADDSGEAAPSAAWKDRIWFGGGIGASFGDVDYVEIAPVVGCRVHPRVSVGAGLFWRRRSDDRYRPSVETTDYGGSVFAQVHVVPSVFAHFEYEYADYEYATLDGTARDGRSSLLVGAGVYRPLGGGVGFFASALYDVTYDESDWPNPYDSPWIYRAGVSVGF